MATIRLVPSLPSSFKTTPLAPVPLPKFSCVFQTNSHGGSLWPVRKERKIFTVIALLNEEYSVDTEEDENEDYEDYLGRELKKQPRPCELYVCNLPRSCDISELVEMFKPFGTVLSAEVSRNPETGISRGCGFVTMGSINSARNAISGLDGSDVGGREMRVKFSVDMSSGRRNPETLNSAPVKNVFYESPFKIYIGNIPWNVKPEELRDHFSQFGSIVSARVLYDRKAGKNRAYAFMSFSSDAEREASLSFNGKEFRGRVIIVRRGVERED